MHFIGKYTFLMMLAGNLASQFVPLNPLADFLFYGSLILGIIAFAGNIPCIVEPDNIKALNIVVWTIFIYVLYHFTLGLEYWSYESWNYILARIITLIIVYLAVINGFDFYYKQAYFGIGIVIALCVIYGTVFDQTAAGGRLFLGFGNPNSTSAISAIGFACFLFSKDKPLYLIIIGSIICLWGVVAGASRTMFAISIIALLLRFKFSWKSIALVSLAAGIVIFAMPYFGYKSIAIDRLIDVGINQNFVGSRKAVREATIYMINQSPLSGWGFKSGIQGIAASITKMGSHNGYLDIMKSMGYPFAIALFTVYLVNLFKIRKDFLSENPYISLHIFIIVLVILGAFYESMIHGVNYFPNSMFYLSFCLLAYKKYFQVSDDGINNHNKISEESNNGI